MAHVEQRQWCVHRHQHNKTSKDCHYQAVPQRDCVWFTAAGGKKENKKSRLHPRKKSRAHQRDN
ncbi:hypothetical protein OUZ56_004959 [Daphnia magna]|uniref:Uncharacterized protein n=1 Tax=Daphnia magna TaxID=35525 RepID=A0ABQ9YRE8_9CRUS|nr:hypothetical protein OUZ56_004959 [Daphnia magna]